MPLFDHNNLPSPNNDLWREGEWPTRTKLETASETTKYQYEMRGSKLETATAISYNHGEMETREQKGLYYRVRVPVVTDIDSYLAPVDLLDVGAGIAAAVPLLANIQEAATARRRGEQLELTHHFAPYRPDAWAYSQQDIAVWQDGLAVKETAPDWSFFGQVPWFRGGMAGYDGGVAGGRGYYQPETAASFIPEKRGLDKPQEDSDEIVDDEYAQAYQDYLDYLVDEAIASYFAAAEEPQNPEFYA